MPRTELSTAPPTEEAPALPRSSNGHVVTGASARLGVAAETVRRRLRSGPRVTLLQVLVVLGAVAGFLLLPDDLLYAGSNALVAGVIGVGLYLPIAFLREMPLNGAGLAGIAAYSFTHLASQGVLGSVEGIVVALGSVVLLSVIGGLASLAVTGLYFVVASLVIQVAIEKVVFSIPGVTGGAAGWSAPQPALDGWFDTQRCVYLIVAVVTLLIVMAVSRLRRSRFGLHSTLVGFVPQGASAVGVRNWEVKLLVFAASGLLIGMGGMLVAFANGTPPATPKFGLIWSVIYLAIPIAAGMRDLAAIVLMGAAFTTLPILLEPLNISPNTLTGVILLSAALLGRHNERLGREARRLARRVLRRSQAGPQLGDTVELVGSGAASSTGGHGAAGAANGAAGNGIVVRDGTPAPSGARRPSWASLPPAAAPMALAGATAVRDGIVLNGAATAPARRRPALTEELEGRDIVVDFGGIRAVNDVSIRLSPGARLGIIGANGAGKTTLFNALTGFVPLHHGQVTLGRQDISHWPSYVRARAGIRRTFQIPRLVDILTVEQNVVCGHGHGDAVARRERVEMLLERFGIAPFRAMPVAALPFGVRREVELVRALSRIPHVLMLDEPVSGLEDEEAQKLLRVLLELQADEGWGLIVIEHDLKFVTAVSDRMMVMEDGGLVAEGPTHEVLKQPQVRRVYLGELVTAG